MEYLTDALQKWLRRNYVESSKCEKHLFSQKQGDKLKPCCLFCQKQEHCSEDCTLVSTLGHRKKFFCRSQFVFSLWTFN